MTSSETIGIVGAVLAFVLAPLLALVAWTFTTFRAEANRAIEQIRAENREQALLIATIKAGAHDERMLTLLESLRDAFNRYTVVMDRIDRKLGASGGEYPVTRPRT